MKKNNQKFGFTLIELLVVIAIIGILTTIVLVMLNGAKDKSRAGSAKATMANIKSQAALYMSANGNYGNITNCDSGMFATDTTLDAQMESLKGYVGVVTCNSDQTSPANDQAWAMSVLLPGAGAGNWCVDSNNRVGVFALTGATDFTCD